MAGVLTGSGRVRRGAGMAFALAFAVVLAGCSSGLKVAPEAYRGPVLTGGAASGVHLIVAELPSPGWSVEIDATRESADRTDVYLTLRRPNPAAVYPQQAVSQRAVTRVDEAEPLGIVARVVDYGSTDDTAYRRVR
jgi:hypothetical protein